jgi:hypothetical protein
VSELGLVSPIIGLRIALCSSIATLRRWNKYWHAYWDKQRMETKRGVEIKTMHDKKDGNQGKMGDGQEELKAQLGPLASRICVNQERMTAMLDACLEKMEATAGELQFVAVHQKVHKEDAAVETIGGLKDQYLAVGSRQQTKKRTQGDGETRQKLAAARGRLTRRAIPVLLCAEHLKIGRSRRDVGRDLNAAMA